MTKEFKKTTKGRDVVYTLESVSSGGTGSGSVATSVGTKKGSGLLVQDTQPSVVRRNPVAKNVNKASSGAGVHKDRKKAMKRGEIKHKKPFAEEGVAEAGPFSYGKPPRKGSVADLTAKKRKEQERGQHPIEPKDQQVGVAKVTKGVAEESIDHEKIYGINLEPFIDYVKRKSGKLGAAKAMDNVKYSLEVYHNKQGEELNKIFIFTNLKH